MSGALLDRFRASGVELSALPGDRIRASGAPLDDAMRATIRDNRAAILAELAASDAGDGELRRLVAIVSADWPADEKADALAAALADPVQALTCFRALVAERHTREAPQPATDDGLRSCWQCSNFGHGGRCLAAQRGESLGAGIGGGMRYEPAMPDRPQRCIAFKPLPADPDQRPGRERWPMLSRELST